MTNSSLAKFSSGAAAIYKNSALHCLAHFIVSLWNVLLRKADGLFLEFPLSPLCGEWAHFLKIFEKYVVYASFGDLVLHACVHCCKLPLSSSPSFTFALSLLPPFLLTFFLPNSSRLPSPPSPFPPLPLASSLSPPAAFPFLFFSCYFTLHSSHPPTVDLPRGDLLLSPCQCLHN